MNVEAIRSIVPDAKPVMAGGQEIGITTRDGSFDYTPEGAKFLRIGTRIERAGIKMHGIYPDGGE